MRRRLSVKLYNSDSKSKSKLPKMTKLGPNQAYCIKYHKIVTMTDGQEEKYKKKGSKTGKMTIDKCQKCETKVRRIMS